MRVLLVDDEPILMGCFEQILSQRHQVRTATSLNAALEILNEGFAPELVIADYALDNGTTGLDLLLEVRRRFPTARRYLMSGNVSQIPQDRDPELAHAVLNKCDDVMFDLLKTA